MEVLASFLPLMASLFIIGLVIAIVLFLLKMTKNDLKSTEENMSKSLELMFLDVKLTVCKIEKGRTIDYTDGLFFVGNTDEELSIVCETDKTPEDTLEREDGWTAFRVSGVLDFSLTGILAKLTKVLADRKIGVFAVSTYNTDYVLIKEKDQQAAEKALADAGYVIKHA